MNPPPSQTARESSPAGREAPRTVAARGGFSGDLEIPKIEEENVAPKASAAIFGVS